MISLRKSRKRRLGQSEIIAAIIGLGIVVLIAMPLVFITLSTLTSRTASEEQRVRFEESLVQEYIVASAEESSENGYQIMNITLRNRGSIPTSIYYITLVLPNESSVMIYVPRANLVNGTGGINQIIIQGQYGATYSPGSPLSLPTGSQAYITLNTSFSISTVTLITGRAQTITLEPRLSPLINETQIAESILITPLFLSILDLNDLRNLGVNQNLLQDPISGDPGVGMSGVDYSLVLLETPYNDATISTEDSSNILINNEYYTRVGNVIVGYNPRTSSSSAPIYNIILSYDGVYSYNYIINGVPKTLGGSGGYCPYGYRIKINGFTGDIKIYSSRYGTIDNIVGIHLYYYDGYYVHLNGTADTVKIYCRDPSITESSYEPYLMVGDFDGNNVTEMLFITEDIGFGHVNTYNDNRPDYDYTGSRLLDDVSTQPFMIKFYNENISNTEVSAVSVIIRFYFHDNAGGDDDECDNRIIFRVGLMDIQTGEIVVSREYGFYELTRYEDTYPPYWQFIIHEAFLPVPDPDVWGERQYVIVFEFQDPFGEKILNDGDIVLGLEYVGVIKFARV